MTSDVKAERSRAWRVGERMGIALEGYVCVTELVHHTYFPFVNDSLEMPVQIARELCVMIQPPERCLRQQKELGATFAQVLQLTNCGRVIGWMMAKIGPVGGLGKVSTMAGTKLQ